MKKSEGGCYILGLDIGANSVGWALLSATRQGKGGRLTPTGIAACGVRIFEAGVQGNLEAGRDESRGVSRRQARAARRRLDRRARRCDKLFRILQGAGLLPPGGPAPGDGPRTAAERRERRRARSKARNELLTALDVQLLADLTEKLRDEAADEQTLALLPHTLPYALRARALDRPLDPFELGRALYHLGQRRGFLSNRKAPPKEKKEEGAVKEGIARVRQGMADTGARTLGEYFASLDPEDQRIRNRWTARDMYEAEFEAIWAAQAPHHPGVLSAELKKRVHRAIFFQRPLRIRKEFIGACPHEPDHKRAPMALLDAQRFRLLQQVNHTRVQMADGTVRELSDAERTTLVNALDADGDLTFTKAKKLLGVPRNAVFNFEEGDEKRFVGNRTAARLGKVFGHGWSELSPEQQRQVVEDVRSIQKPETLARRAKSAWGLSDQQAADLAQLALEDGYCRLSRQALAKLLPYMEQSLTYQGAVGEVYGHELDTPAVDLLPPVAHAVPDLRNPAVARALTELRKVVNGIVRTYGRPAAIRIELARDLRRSRRQRQRATAKMRDIERDREVARELIRTEAGIQEPRRSDIQKVLLAQECAWTCPYTGKAISMAGLLGPHPQFDVEHIIPFSRSLDNSFLNKTLCEIEENRARKQDRTPHEAYAEADPDRWDQILARVRRFHGSAAREKLRRFQIVDPSFDDFVSQQLNDTRYASRLAIRYLGLLYGPEARSRVQASRGGVTGFLRDEWDLNTILGDGPGKSRDDHRHHAVDAIAIALTERATVKMLSDAAEHARRAGRSRFAPVPLPWSTFLDDVRAAVAAICVSNRVSRRVSGPMHEETFYSPGHSDPDGRPCVHVRKPVEALSRNEIPLIVDDKVREAVEAKLAELGGDLKAFAEPANHPVLAHRNGKSTAIHRVRIRKPIAPFPVGAGHRERHVVTKLNHHVEIVEVHDHKGNPKWEGRLVSQFEAMRRHRAGEPIVRRDHGLDAVFLFSLSPSESVLIAEDGQEFLLRVIGVSQRASGGVEFEFRRNTDARPMTDLRKIKGARVRKSADALRQLAARKIVIDPVGRIRRVGRD